ncbi:sensor histidine kinase [Patulibacter sp. SYSU D01012]|uniref:sensor histidine kinase n=1 Tax=Patulibacter sp. SYSU D01012 TaxID=2817381 RepID=UPI001B30DECE|nr:sensor histidine kinase [Patulibacter sp. SYSU D01012]
MSTRTPTVPADGPAHAGPDRSLGVLGRRAARDLAFLVAGLVTGTAFFSVAVTLASLSVGLLVLVVGLPVAALSFTVLRWCADVERHRVAAITGARVEAHYRPASGPLFSRALEVVRDPRRWRDLAYLVVQFPLSVVAFSLAVGLWGTALSMILYPLYYWALPEGGGTWLNEVGFDSLPLALVACVLGFALLPVSFAVARALVAAEVALARTLLGDDRAALAARVSRLEETRAGVVEASSAELRRIERDLHDGAQARMVAVAMELGMAEERLARDPEAAREMLRGARDETRRALAEMRDLVRGIAPSVLADRGLEAAIGSIAARAPVAVELDVALAERPPSSVETAAYFVVAEALTNAGKHAAGTRVTVRVRREDDVLAVRVTDDGPGGARLAPGGGLAGLRDRVAALDGTLDLTSPDGGPTTVEARIPCAS